MTLILKMKKSKQRKLPIHKPEPTLKYNPMIKRSAINRTDQLKKHPLKLKRLLKDNFYKF